MMVRARLAVAFGIIALLLALLPTAQAAAQQPITEWTQRFGTDMDDRAAAVAVDRTGNVYVAGSTVGSLVTGQPNRGEPDAFVRCYTEAGAVVWTRQFSGDNLTEATDIAVDPSGNIYVVGFTFGNLGEQTNSGEMDAFIRQYHTDGTEGWTRQFGTAYSDRIDGIATDTEGNVYVTGNTSGTLTDQTSASGNGAFIRKYDQNGFAVWTRQFGTDGDEWISAIAVDLSGNSYVAGYSIGIPPDPTRHGEFSPFVRQFRSDGSEGWIRQFNLAAVDMATGIAVDTAGRINVIGWMYTVEPTKTSVGTSADFVRQYDANGTERWSRQFGDGDWNRATGVEVDSSGTVYVSGYTSGALSGQANAGDWDAFVRQYGNDGSEGWTDQIGSAGREQANSIAVDANRNILVAGQVAENSRTWPDAFVAKLRPTDTFSINPATPIAPFSSDVDGTYFRETGHSLAYGFKSFWEHNGGLTIFGYPLTEEFTENNRTVQYTERQRFEYHPEFTGTPYVVELGLLGTADAQRNNLLTTQPFQPLPATTLTDNNCTFFPETGHRLCFGFKSYWQSHGVDLGDPGISFREPLALFGYPISEEFVDPNTGFVTQYFQRAVFEYHPENAGTPYTVLLKRLGASDLHARGWMP